MTKIEEIFIEHSKSIDGAIVAIDLQDLDNCFASHRELDKLSWTAQEDSPTELLHRAHAELSQRLAEYNKPAIVVLFISMGDELTVDGLNRLMEPLTILTTNTIFGVYYPKGENSIMALIQSVE